MGSLIVHLDTTVSISKVKEALKMVKGIESVSDKITRSDFEALADEVLVREMKKADKGPLLSYEDGKKEFEKNQEKNAKMIVKYRKAFFTDVGKIKNLNQIEEIEFITEAANRCTIPEEIPGYKSLRHYPGKARIEVKPYRIDLEVIGDTIIFKRVLPRSYFYLQFP